MLVPRSTYAPAQYPRVTAPELDREVTPKDMSDFFVTFMQVDQLGMLSNIHLQLADAGAAGTLDPACIKLAQLASTSVDFSKTGVPVDMSEVPRYSRFRPDFMAPSPRVFIEAEQGTIDFEAEIREDAALEDLEVETQPMRYYRSEKVLGHLYRAIDEEQFLKNMQDEREALLRVASSESVSKKLLRYLRREAAQYGVLFDHHQPLAAEIQAGYARLLTETCTFH